MSPVRVGIFILINIVANAGRYIFKNKAWKLLELDIIDNPAALKIVEEWSKWQTNYTLVRCLTNCWENDHLSQGTIYGDRRSFAMFEAKLKLKPEANISIIN